MRNRLSDEQGFTLIELLVVILIIGILAAIALPNFLGQRSRGQDASAKSNARNAVSMVESCYTDSQAYSLCTTPSNGLGNNTGLDFTKITVTATGSAGADGFTAAAVSVSGNTFSIVKNPTNGAITRTCVVPSGKDRGACPASGSW